MKNSSWGYKFLFDNYKTLLLYSLCCRFFFVSSFGAFLICPVSHPISTLYTKIPDFYADIPCYLGFYAWYSAWGAVGWGGGGGGVGYSLWLGSVHRLVCGFNLACSLSYQPISRFRIPSRLLFPQGTGEPSSVDHPWVGPCNGNFGASVYPPPYLRKGFFPFLFHESTQLRENY